jgi:hypothetical protein
MKFLPLVVVHMYPELFAKAKDTIANMSRANYFYLIAYPEYGGYRVEHDPTFTAYIAAAPSTSPSQPTSGGIIIVAIIVVVVVCVAVIALRRKPKQLPPPSP